MTPCHGSTYSAKLSSHQPGPDAENLFCQQQISETITPHYHNHPGSEKLKLGEPEVLACLLRDRRQKTFGFLNRLCLLISNLLPPLTALIFHDPTCLFYTYISLSTSYLHYAYLYIYCLYTYTILILYSCTKLLYCITP